MIGAARRFHSEEDGSGSTCAVSSVDRARLELQLSPSRSVGTAHNRLVREPPPAVSPGVYLQTTTASDRCRSVANPGAQLARQPRVRASRCADTVREADAPYHPPQMHGVRGPPVQRWSPTSTLWEVPMAGITVVHSWI